MERHIKTDMLQQYGCVKKKDSFPGHYAATKYRSFKPYRDFRHFTGHGKPWMQKISMEETSSFESIKSPEQYWYYILGKAVAKLGMEDKIDLTNLNVSKAKFGLYPTHKMIVAVYQYKEEAKQTKGARPFGVLDLPLEYRSFDRRLQKTPHIRSPPG